MWDRREENIMERRRQFLKKGATLLGGLLVWMTPLSTVVGKAFAEAKKIILPKGTARETLTHSNRR